jgi:hypothetical protein
MSSPTKKELRARAAIAEALTPHGFPSKPGRGLCFDVAGDEAFARGWPNVRRLVDPSPSVPKAIAIAEKALDRIDPSFGIEVPREVARRYLLGYSIGPCLFGDAHHRPENLQRRVRRAELIRSERQVDRALLEETLASHARGLGDAYTWRWPMVIYLFEAFLGADPVADSLVAHLTRAARSEADFGDHYADRFRDNTCLHLIAGTLPWLFMRASNETREALEAQLREVPDPDSEERAPQAFRAQLRAIGARSTAPHPSALLLSWNLALAYGHREVIERILALEGHQLLWDVARVCWAYGTAPLARPLSLPGHDLPRMLETIAPLKDPAVVRVMAHLAALGATKKEAAAWLRAHAAYARPILTALSALDDKKEQRAVAAALAAIGSDAPIENDRQLTEEEAEAEIGRLFAGLGSSLGKAESVAKKKDLIRAAYDRYVEVQAASGHPTPEAYFTHRFGDFGLGEYGMLAVDAIE